VRGSGHDPFEVLSRHLREDTEEDYDKPRRDTYCPGQNSNPAPPEYKFRALLIRETVR
jgi:hypothetical protein